LLKDFGIAAPPPADQPVEPRKSADDAHVAEDRRRTTARDGVEHPDEFAVSQAHQWEESATQWDMDFAGAEEIPQAEFLDEAADELENDITSVENLDEVAEPPSSVPSDVASHEESHTQSVGESPALPKSRAPSFWESIFGPRPQPEPGVSEGLADEGFADARESARSLDRSGEQFPPDEIGFSEPTPDAEVEQPPRRRSRHRRRGRGRARPEQTSESDATVRAASEFDEDDLDGEDLETDESDRQEGGSPSSARTKSAGHRTIPTWSEAIGSIVDANLQSRTDRRRTVSRSSGSRSRPRGRRKKKP
jgi:hypothetical protein